jgi:cysteine desulfurase
VSNPPSAIYLDHNATTPVHPEVRDAMLPWLGERWGNPSSRHAYGADAAAALAEARGQVAALIGAQPQELLFTSGGTEADNMVVLATEVARRRLLMSAVEHPAITEAAVVARADGWEVRRLPVDGRGVLDLSRADDLDSPAGLVSVMLAQNETGVIQPVAEVARRARGAADDVVVHSDAAQAVGKIPVDVRELGVDLLTIVSHKFYGPCGIGALWIRPGIGLRPIFHGGGQGGGLRPGTEPMALVVGLGAACALARRTLEQEGLRQQRLRDRLWEQLAAGIEGLVRTSADAPTLPNTLHVCVPGRAGADILGRCPGVAASTGSACHADDATVSGVLGAMGVSARVAMGALRLTLGRSTTEADVDRAAAALIAAAS